jgi:hypothetical protein
MGLRKGIFNQGSGPAKVWPTQIRAVVAVVSAKFLQDPLPRKGPGMWDYIKHLFSDEAEAKLDRECILEEILSERSSDTRR